MAIPPIWVSACLLGQPVRYDGGHKHQQGLEQWLAGWAQVVPLCPEVFAGLGTPRPPIQRLAVAEPRLVLAHTGQPAAAGLSDACAQLVASSLVPAAAILKARSPSCGHGTTPLFDPAGEQVAVGDGVFVEQLRRRYPTLLIVDESGLLSPAQREAFRARVLMD